MPWDTEFTALFDRCVAKYRSGNLDFNTYYEKSDLKFLGSIGCQEREFFDFVEDFCDRGEPSRETALLVAAVRRDYFYVAQNEEKSNTPPITADDVPARDAELEGIPYLPRIIAKAEAKLRGELHPDLMFCCGGDRRFLQEHDTHPADFLRYVWSADGDPQKILELIKD